MRIIDKTPFQNEQGQVEFLPRLQGTLKYGSNWYPELEAQKKVMSQLDLVLEKGFVLIRNFNLPGSEVVVPFILVGLHGVSVIYVTHTKGFYEAKGDQWNRLDNGRPVAAQVDLLNRVVRLTRATTVYFQRQKITLSAPIEPVLIGADPGLHIESLRPVARVVMSDAIKQYASGLLTARPILRKEQVYDLAERIVTPRKVEAEPEPAPVSMPIPEPAVPYPSREPEPEEPDEFQSPPARLRAIFDAAETAKPFDPTDLSFAFEDEPPTDLSSAGARPGVTETSPSQPLKRSGDSRRKGFLGLQPLHLGCLGAIVLVEVCILAGFAWYLSTLP
jgi:hypothetical protein